MEVILVNVMRNRVVLVPMIAWLLAQIIKIVVDFVHTRKFDIDRFWGAGGMPSSHSSYICALSTAVGFLKGFDSAIFGVTLAIAIVVMVDAAGIRRASGKQAAILNTLMYSQCIKDEHLVVDGAKLKEKLGHSPLEVFVGALFGIFVASMFFYITIN